MKASPIVTESLSTSLKPFTLSLPKRRARLRQAQPERMWAEHHGCASPAFTPRPQGRSERDQLLGGRSTGTGTYFLYVRIPTTQLRRRLTFAQQKLSAAAGANTAQRGDGQAQ